jgi:hypothetical protein
VRSTRIKKLLSRRSELDTIAFSIDVRIRPLTAL